VTARLRAVPWHALAGLGPLLAPPLTDVLSGTAAERVLDRFLRAHKTFTPEQRAVSAESLFGVGLWRRRLRAHLPSGTPLQLLAVLATELGHAPDATRWLELDPLPPLAPTPTDWCDLHSIPDWIAEHLTRVFGPDDAPRFAASLNVPGPVCLRARDDRTELARRLAAHGLETTPGALAPHALLVITPRPNLYGLPPEFLGTFEVQDEGSQLLSLLVGAQPGEDVLELCAGAGGKSLHLASLVGPQGRVHACDLDLEKLERLRTRASKANARVLIQGRVPPPSLRAPRVFIDAPCSELGSLRRGPDLRWRLKPETVAQHVVVQRELLERGLQHLAPHGTLTYATCTITREENEDLVHAFLAAHPELELVQQLRVDPHTHGTDGFRGFVLTRRPGPAPASAAREAASS
jgi:16S rRNA (cytosine967-C5)-methyltransferase